MDSLTLILSRDLIIYRRPLPAVTQQSGGYLHYVFDLWEEVWREKAATGDMIVVRYADDLVAGFQHRADAERFLKEFHYCGENSKGYFQVWRETAGKRMRARLKQIKQEFRELVRTALARMQGTFTADVSPFRSRQIVDIRF